VTHAYRIFYCVILFDQKKLDTGIADILMPSFSVTIVKIFLLMADLIGISRRRRVGCRVEGWSVGMVFPFPLFLEVRVPKKSIHVA